MQRFSFYLSLIGLLASASEGDEDSSVTMVSVPNSCIGREDNDDAFVKLADGQSFPLVQTKCRNEFMIVDLYRDKAWADYFISMRQYHYNLMGPKKDHHVNWQEWMTVPQDEFLISPDCNACDADHELNSRYQTQSAYYMTPVASGCTQLPIGRIGCDMDWHTYACRVCESAETREPGYWIFFVLQLNDHRNNRRQLVHITDNAVSLFAFLVGSIAVRARSFNAKEATDNHEETLVSVPNSCVGKDDSDDTIVKLADGQSFPLVRTKCRNEFMIVDMHHDASWEDYFVSMRQYHYNLMGPSKDDHVNWQEWMTVPQDEFLISPDCNSCDADFELNGKYKRQSAYYMTPVASGCTQLPIGRIGCDMDWHTYSCRVCETSVSRVPGYWLSYEVYNGLNDPDTTLHFMDEVDEENFAKYGLCGFTVRDAKAEHSAEIDTFEHCKTVTHEDVEGEAIMPRRKPSMGQDGRFCMCVKPQEYAEFQVAKEQWREKANTQTEGGEQQQQQLASDTDDDNVAEYRLYQKDFEKGTYRIQKPGKYIVMEDITFDFKAPDGKIWPVWLYGGDAKSAHSLITDTFEHCKTVTHEDLEDDVILPRRKPSMGHDGRFCMCVKPQEYAEFQVPKEQLREKRESIADVKFLSQQHHENDRDANKEWSSESAIKIYRLYQKDFEKGTYRIQKPGKYIVMEDITFDFKAPDGYMDGGLDTYNGPSDWWPTYDQIEDYPGAGDLRDPYFLGFWAGITIEADNVILELNHHSLQMSEALFYQQSFFALISLTSQVFLPGQGPGFFGASPIAASNVMIRNGVLGLTSHHAIQGNFNKNVLLENLQIYDFKTHGIQLNGFDGVTIKNVDVGPNRKLDMLTPYYAHMKALLPTYRMMVENEPAARDECFQFRSEGRYHTCYTLQDMIDTVQTLLDMAFEYVVVGVDWDAKASDSGQDHNNDDKLQKKLDLWTNYRSVLINDHQSTQTATLYGIFLNYIGSNVIGWYAGSENTKSHNVVM
eukprot:CAMPEP_0202726258 /NCGR_PEP_ID=MMETSP1385-20130828/184520_1 /ASSEMBLY_ACC=CAM_ASM_000861 /TAXON_ID=933848 /ORGANISM="Elphidium margaritaceum" /LENGTH=996 /DNA_ID=CAMNT_0049392475 /DNA_START=97 /DNA_END=3086 /DNA_ORIENTATION=+